MSIIGRFAAFWLVVLTFTIMAGATPAGARTTADYRAELDSVALEMRALWGEIERFQIQQRYCLPPYGPVKQPDTMMMQAYSARANALNDKYNALKQSLKDFLATNTRLHAELMIAGKDPSDKDWFDRWDSSRDKMIDERNRKRDALAKAPERDCTPRTKPAIAVQPPPALVLPQRPTIAAFNWPALPPHFCSELEKLDWKIANINPHYLREAEVAHAVARYRSQVEGLVNDHVQAGRPIPPALAEARRQAIADSREMTRIEKANAEFYRRFAAVPVIDCKPPPPKEEPAKAVLETGMAPPPDDPRHRALLDTHNAERRIFGSPPLQWDRALAASAQRYAEVMARTGQLAHSPREGRGTARENLSQGLPGWGPQQLMGNWLKERSKFKPGTYPDVSITGNWEDVSHYSQMVWPKTTNVGCGIADGRGFQWLVCHYNPGGNKDGVYISNEPKIAGDIAPANSGSPTLPREKLPIGGGMQQIDPPAGPPPPPPPPPTGRDDAPDGDEARHPLRDYFMKAFGEHATAWMKSDLQAQAEALAKMHYALQELLKRLRDARRARGLSKVNPAEVQKLIDELNSKYREANELSRPRQPGEERG